MTYGKPFDRKKTLCSLEFYVEHHWGSYEELINLTVKDLREIKIAVESNRQEEQIEQIRGGL